MSVGSRRKRVESTLESTDDALVTVCSWLGLDADRHKATEVDYLMTETGRPSLGGVGSESLSKKAAKQQTDGVMALGGLERKLLPKSARATEAKKRPAPESESDDGMDKGTSSGTKVMDTRSGMCRCLSFLVVFDTIFRPIISLSPAELEMHAAKQRAKQRKRRKRLNTAKTSPHSSPALAPKAAAKKGSAAAAPAAPVPQGADD